ncbi:MAG: HlyD family efflux transporter periplasmic adaptor subunit [Clostridia bacterium]|nr:HlyD family efflux transporter periplasmic adaptor subunit [Clostridia bacterium]MDY2930223.1 HlyD family efflux transporter periplasmic adaptor subunit [Clostridiaceae bacterium]
MKRTIRRILAAAAVIGILIYAGSQVAVNLTQQIETADALEVTVQQTVSAQGWFIREQVPVTGSGSGTAEYLVSDGEKVAKGEKLAVFFSDEGSRVAFDQEGALRQQLDALEYAYSMITSGVDSRKMDQLIMEEIRTLSAALAQGNAADTEGDYAALQQLVVSRGSTETDKEAFEGQIADLKSQIAALQKQYAGGSGSLRAPASGYFVSGSDGYESVLSPAGLDSLTPETLDSLAPGETGMAGSITTGFCWYCAIPLSAADAALLQQRERITVHFPQLETETLDMEVHALRTVGERAILILKSDRMKARYLTSRVQDVDIVVGEYTGLKVPAQALRQSEGQWGVFVLSGSVAQFKPVTWIYQTESYYLVPCAKSAKEGLYRYDRIITRGRDLADNKLVE